MKMILIMLMAVIVIQASDTLTATYVNPKDSTLTLTAKLFNFTFKYINPNPLYPFPIYRVEYSAKLSKPAKYWCKNPTTATQACLSDSNLIDNFGDNGSRWDSGTTSIGDQNKDILIGWVINYLANSQCGSKTFCTETDISIPYATFKSFLAVETKVAKKGHMANSPVSIYDISGRLIDKAMVRNGVVIWNWKRAGIYVARYPDGAAMKIVRL